MFDLPRELQLVWWGVFGLFVGSFLNVAIHRLPLEDETVSKPRRSRCPSCKTELTWRENIPLLSWLAQLGRCRSCGWRIPWRYPLVEALTAALWVVAAALAPEGRFDVTLVWVVALSGLIVATFVDFACFEIPDEVSIGGMVLAPLASLAVPALHADGWVAQAFSDGAGPDRLAALIASLCGLAVGGGVLIAIGWLGKLAFGRDAMGFGDVKLLAAGGGLVGAERVLAALVVAAFAASIVGLVNMLRFLWLSRSRSRRRGGSKPFARSLASARICGRYLPFGPYLALGIGIVLLAWDDVRRLALSWLS